MKTEIIIGRTYSHKRKKSAPDMTVLACDLIEGKVTCESSGVSVAMTKRGIGVGLRLMGKQTFTFPVEWFCKRYK